MSNFCANSAILLGTPLSIYPALIISSADLIRIKASFNCYLPFYLLKLL